MNEEEQAALAARVETAEASLAELRAAQAATVTFAREQARAANPKLPAELIDGDTVESITESLERAHRIAQEAIKLGANGTSNVPIPTGGQRSQRVEVAPDASPIAKIRAGLGSFKG